MNEYIITFRNGHNMTYTAARFLAPDWEAALENFNEQYGANFDHKFFYAYENRECIYDYESEENLVTI